MDLVEKLIKTAQKLDESGKFALADKVDNVIMRLAQEKSPNWFINPSALTNINNAYQVSMSPTVRPGASFWDESGKFPNKPISIPNFTPGNELAINNFQKQMNNLNLYRAQKYMSDIINYSNNVRFQNMPIPFPKLSNNSRQNLAILNQYMQQIKPYWGNIDQKTKQDFTNLYNYIRNFAR